MPRSARFAAIVLALSISVAQAATPAAAAGDKPPEVKAAQQNRMKACNADARVKELKGLDRRAFMSECLRKKA